MNSTVAAAPENRGSVTAVAFGAVVAMWTAGYLARLPGVQAPGWLVMLLLLAIMTVAGFELGRRSRGSALTGALTGALAGVLIATINLLVLGGLLTGGAAGPPLVVWLPGALLFGAAWGAVSAWAGRAASSGRQLDSIDWTHAMTIVGAAATFVLLAAGGLVTSAGAGLAVPDWPNSFGYAMFLYPISRMTGGVYFEHAHRLFGTLVGLTTLAVAWQVLRADRRRPLVVAALAAVFFVVVQGILGGLRVTGSFTLSAEAEALAPSLTLALVHGVTGQLFFTLMVLMTVLTSRTWKRALPVELEPAGAMLRRASLVLPPLLLVQLLLGALVRHRSMGVMAHVGFAVIVALVALVIGTMFWGAIRAPRRLGLVGLALVGLTLVQVVLGLAALLVTIGVTDRQTLGSGELLVATAHQSNGALMLACSVAIVAWSARITRASAPAGA